MSGWGSGQGRLDFYPGVLSDIADAECQITVPEKKQAKKSHKKQLGEGLNYICCSLQPKKKKVVGVLGMVSEMLKYGAKGYIFY